MENALEMHGIPQGLDFDRYHWRQPHPNTVQYKRTNLFCKKNQKVAIEPGHHHEHAKMIYEHASFKPILVLLIRKLPCMVIFDLVAASVEANGECCRTIRI